MHTHTLWIPPSLSKTYFCEDPLFSWVFRNEHCSHAVGIMTSVAYPATPCLVKKVVLAGPSTVPGSKQGLKYLLGEWINDYLLTGLPPSLTKKKFRKKKVRDALFTWTQHMIHQMKHMKTGWLVHQMAMIQLARWALDLIPPQS